MDGKEIKKIINENIKKQDENIEIWKAKITKSTAEDMNVFSAAHGLSLAREYRQAYVDLLVQVEREEKENNQ